MAGLLLSAWPATRQAWAAAPRPLLRYPYLQDVSKDRARILWTSASVTNPAVAVDDGQGERIFTATAREFPSSLTERPARACSH